MAGSALALPSQADRPGLDQLVETARGYARAGMSANTRRAYGADWDDFSSWCASVDACPLPADPAMIALYLTARAPKLAASTLARRLSAIRIAHRAANLTQPESGDLRAIWAGIRRTHGRPPRKKRAMVTEDLRKVVRKLPPSLAGKRDKALLLLGFAAALRRSELAAVAIEKGTQNVFPIRIVFVAHGVEVHIDRSKADQEGEGAVLGVPYGKTQLCPVAALRDWITAAGIESGPVFRAIDRHGNVGSTAISPYGVALAVKAAARRAGLDPASFGGHSLRAGLVTSAVANNVATDVIMRQTRHARYDTLRGYIRDGERFKRNAASKVGL